VTSFLPEVLREFVRNTSTCRILSSRLGLSGELNEKLERGELDLVCGKRRPERDRGRVFWARSVSLVVRQSATPRSNQRRYQLILYSPPSIYPRQSFSPRLSGAVRPWRIVCTSGSLSGLPSPRRSPDSASRFSLGDLIPTGLVELPSGHGLPDLGTV